MKRFLSVSFAAVALLIGGAASQAQAGFQGPMNIVGLDVGDSDALYIRLSANTVCGSPIVHVSRAASYYNDMLAMALAAQANNKPVNVWVSACRQNNENGPIVRMVHGLVF